MEHNNEPADRQIAVANAWNARGMLAAGLIGAGGAALILMPRVTRLEREVRWLTIEVDQGHRMLDEATVAGRASADEVVRLKADLARVTEERVDAFKRDGGKDALAVDVRLLYQMEEALREKPDDATLMADAGDLAKRVARQVRGSSLVWRVLLKTKVLDDGTSEERAIDLLGPPTERSDQYLGWYFNPNHARHVAPHLRAQVTKEGLAGWSLVNG